MKESFNKKKVGLERFKYLTEVRNQMRNIRSIRLDKNFSIKATISISNREKSQYNLYITKSQMSLLTNLVLKHMHPDMLYKLNI